MKLSLLFLGILTVCSFAADTATVAIDSVVKVTEKVVELANDVKNNGGGPTMWLLAAAIVNLLMTLMKFKPIAKILNTPKMKSIKPWIALSLGIATGFISDIVAGGPNALDNAIAGVVTGLGAIGIHEFTGAAGMKEIFGRVNSILEKVSIKEAKEVKIEEVKEEKNAEA